MLGYIRDLLGYIRDWLGTSGIGFESVIVCWFLIFIIIYIYLFFGGWGEGGGFTPHIHPSGNATPSPERSLIIVFVQSPEMETTKHMPAMFL